MERVFTSFKFSRKYFTWLQIEYFSFSGAPGESFQTLENKVEIKNTGVMPSLVV